MVPAGCRVHRRKQTLKNSMQPDAFRVPDPEHPHFSGKMHTVRESRSVTIIGIYSESRISRMQKRMCENTSIFHPNTMKVGKGGGGNKEMRTNSTQCVPLFTRRKWRKIAGVTGPNPPTHERATQRATKLQKGDKCRKRGKSHTARKTSQWQVHGEGGG